MKEMSQELNTDLLRKIRYWESGELLSKVVFCFLLLGIILYFIAGKVYIPIRHMVQKRNSFLKKKKIQKKEQKRRKIRFWLVFIISGGVISGLSYTSCYVKAAAVIKTGTQKAGIIEKNVEKSAEETTEKDIGRGIEKATKKNINRIIEEAIEKDIDRNEEETTEKSIDSTVGRARDNVEKDTESRTNPKLSIYSQGWKKGKGDFSEYLFRRENTPVTLQLEEDAFGNDSEKEQFLFQISEEGDSTKIKNYEQKDFRRQSENEEELAYQTILDFRAEEGEERLYKIHLKYLNMLGMPLIEDKEKENKYGEVIEGTFKSKNMVIDRKCPEIKDIYIKKTGDIENVIKQTYYNSLISGVINIKEAYPDWDSVHIWAVPLDQNAKKLAERDEAGNNQGAVDILSWKRTRKKDFFQISFDFFLEGKWKICFSCADIAGNKGVYLKTGEEVAESEGFIIDSTAPELSVSYAGISNIMEEPFSVSNVNKKIKNNEGKITSTKNQIFAGKDSEITIRIKEMNMDEEDSEIKLYRIVYEEDGKQEQIELSEEELYNKISREQQNQSESRKNQNPLSGKDEENSGSETVFLYSIKNLEEGHYKVVIHCKDKAGNRISSSKDNETDVCIHNGEYESPLYTVDTASPVIREVFCNQNPVRETGERQYFQNASKIIIRIQEENFNRSNFFLKGKLFYASGRTMDAEWRKVREKAANLQWKSYYKDGVRINEASMNIDIEANYTLYFECVDGAAHNGNQMKLEMTYDRTKPEIIYTGENNSNEDLIFKPEIKSKTELETKLGMNEDFKTNLFSFRRYQFWRYFSKKRVCVSIQVKDEVSGVEKINYKFIPFGYTDKDADKNTDKDTWLVSQNMKSEDNAVQAQMHAQTEIEKQELSKLMIIVSPKEKNFKGYLKVYGQDYSGNTGKMINSKGIISEDEKLHDEVSKITIKMPKPVFTDTEKSIRYYNKSIPVNATFEDRQSGVLKTILCGRMMNLSESLPGEDIKINQNKETEIQAENSVVWDAENVVQRQNQRIVLEAEKFQLSDAHHPVTIQGKMTDNVGYVSEKYFDEKLVIDTVKPEIKVEYDKNNETGYYNTPRKATVIVKERNFSPDFVKWDIKGNNQNYRIGEWRTTEKKGAEDIYYCDIYFEEDGEDYAINLSVSDYAGNKSEWKDRGYFTIDRSSPEISIKIEGEDGISTDEGKKASEVKYFNKAKEVQVCIQDKNFDKDQVEYNIRAIEGEKEVKIAKPGNYIKEGEKYYNRVILKKEARYYIQVKCTDKAGNESEKKEITFVIDTTAPVITVKGVKDDTIYEGKVIMPEVVCADKYLDLDSVRVHLMRANGKIVPKKEWNYEYFEEKGEGENKKKTEARVQFRWDNLPEKKANDGIYQLVIQGKDKAGNRIKDNFKIVFRVNRWGTQFVLDDNLKNKINKHYLKTAPEFRLKEECVKQTKSTVVILKDNEERRTIRKEDVKERIIADKKEEKYGWYEKEYIIRKDNFAEEGEYRITFQADSKKKEVHFVVDKTPPVVSINGLESDIYEEKEHEFTVNIMDNYAFAKMELYIRKSFSGIPKNYIKNYIKKRMKKHMKNDIGSSTKPDQYNSEEIQKIIITPEDLDANHMFKQKIKESEQKQTIYYVAWDKAGNKVDSYEREDTRSCLVTSNSNKVLKENYKKEDGSIRGIVASAAVLTAMYILVKAFFKHALK